VWLIGVVVCLLAANHGCSCVLMWAMDGHIVHCGISSCQSAATSEIIKVLLVLSMSLARSAIASTGLCFFRLSAKDVVVLNTTQMIRICGIRRLKRRICSKLQRELRNRTVETSIKHWSDPQQQLSVARNED